jgi:hypothetical protein
MRTIEIVFDSRQLAEEIARLSPAVLERFLDHGVGDAASMRFDIFVRDHVVALAASDPDKIVIGFDFSRCLELGAAT